MKQLEEILDHVASQTFMTLVTTWALFGDDMRLLVPYVNNDDHFTVISILCLITFVVEIGACSVSALCTCLKQTCYHSKKPMVGTSQKSFAFELKILEH